MSKEIKVYKVKDYQPPRRGAQADRFKFCDLVEEGDTNAVPLAGHNKHTLRTLINRQRRYWEKNTGNEYSVHWEEKGKKAIYYIRLEKLKKK